jgi:hypothetical protein
LLATALCVACASANPDAYDERIASAVGSVEGDAALQARAEEVRAAAAREESEAAIEDFELRVRQRRDTDRDDATRLLARVPIPVPGEARAQRSARRAETEASIARLEGEALRRSAENCELGVRQHTHRLRSDLYAGYASQLRHLLDWNAELLESGRINESRALRFELEREVDIARRAPGPAPAGPPGTGQLPPIGGRAERLDRDPSRVHALVRQSSPSVAERDALASRFRALSDRERSRRYPWFEFVDVGYEFEQGGPDTVGAQLAVRVPISSSLKHSADRYSALSRAQALDGARAVELGAALGTRALDLIDRFESEAARWSQLLELASRADAIAAQWRDEGAAGPSEVADLFDRAFAARSAVLDARVLAGEASCELLLATGVPLESWPRQR